MGAEEASKHPDMPIEVWATDEHRLGLKPIHRRVWAPIGERPIALGHHRYEWLYVTAFVAPMSGETVWDLPPREQGLCCRGTPGDQDAHRGGVTWVTPIVNELLPYTR